MSAAGPGACRIGFVLHVMQVAGAEVLVAETIRRLGARLDPVILCLDGVGALGEQLISEGVPVVSLSRRPGLDVGLPGRMAAEIDRRGLEVVHAHQYTPFFYAAFAKLLAKQKVHLIFTEHGRHYPDVVSWRRRTVNRALLSRLADDVNGVSRFSVNSLAEVDGFGGRRLDVIPNGIDAWRYASVSRTEARQSLGLAGDRKYIACVARFHPVKDHAMLLEAFAVTAARVPDVELLLAGDGPLRDALVAQAGRLGVSDRVRFLGVRSDVPLVLRAADVFALTSLCEAASLTLLEAMASELPVVVTGTGGSPEIVEHGRHGFLVPRGGSAAAADAFTTLLRDEALASRMGREGRARVLERYLLDATVSEYFSRYSEAATRIRARGGQPHEVPV